MITLVLVTGSGRSGTSSVAGTMKRLGMHVPQPEVEADERNPRGYYEPAWVAEFHKTWLDAVPVRTIDARPGAGAIAMSTATPEREDTLRSWLREELAARPDGAVVVVKETRAYWVYPMWQRIVDSLAPRSGGPANGVRLTSLTMVRHPTQVVRSRDAAYLTGKSDSERRRRETANVAAWMNSVFETERATRGNPRAFVPYLDLVADWRAAMTRACAQIGVDPGDLQAPHPVDDFISASLNRSSDSWEGLEVPDWLRDAGEQTWQAATRLVLDPADADATDSLERLRADYVERYDAAAALTQDEVLAEGMRAKQEHRAKRQTLQDRLAVKNERLERLRAELEQARRD